MKVKKNIIAVLLFVLSAGPQFMMAQNKGDEGNNMGSQANKDRNKQLIDEAKKDWWNATMKTHDSRIAWWQEARFGMFIHWGIYSLPGGEWQGKPVTGYAEHLMRKEKISRAGYLELAQQFNPTKFNADEWVRTAKQAGMGYLIITAKHHDGFAMYNSKVSDFNVVKQSAWKHDPMADLVAACKKYGVKFGFYYSHAFDWEHPDAPGNDWEYKNPGGDLNLFGKKNEYWYDLHPELIPKAAKYVDEKAIPQIKELLLMYHPDILWFDTPRKLPLSENIRILKAIRETAPNVVVNGRLVQELGDYKNTADRPAEFYPVEGDWEAIPTTNESYGYSKFDKTHKSAGFFIQLLAKAASRGGNLLTNIGPMGDGDFAPEDKEILKGISEWMSKNSSSIYKTIRTPLPFQSWGVSTRKDNLLYLHVFNWPANGKLMVGGLISNITKAYLLTDATKKALTVNRLNDKDISIDVPKTAPNTIDTVIVIETKGAPKTDTLRFVADNSSSQLLAFDADQKGKGFGKGDGKAASYYVDGWKTTAQSLSWDFRTNIKFNASISIKYVATNKTGGTYLLNIDGKTSEHTVIPKDGNNIIIDELTTVALVPGKHSITITPVTISNVELMKIMELQINPK